MISFFLLSIVPLGIAGVMTYAKSSKAMEEKIQTYSIQILNKTRDNIQAKMEKIEYTSDQVYVSSLIQDTLPPVSSQNHDFNVKSIKSVTDLLREKYSIVTDVTVAKIIGGKGILYTAIIPTSSLDPDYAVNLTRESDKLENMASALRGAPKWLLPLNKYLNHDIYLIRSINSLINNEQLGTLIVAVKNSYFSNAFKDIYLGSGTDIFIMDETGMVISSAQARIPIGEKYFDSTLIDEIKNNEVKQNASFPLRFASQQYLATYTKIRNTNWYLIGTIPYSYINSESYKIGFYIQMISIAFLAFSILLSFLISGSISAPLKRLVRAMNKTKQGDFSVAIDDDRKDELAEVGGNFNNMVREINALMLDIKNNERQKRFAELKALQAQINPHFISNTLNTVCWLANVQKAENIGNIVRSLMHLLEISVGKDDEFIQVRKEMDYVRDYLVIQDYRYYNKFKVHFEVEEQAMDFLMPKFLVQPIVENALIHGIEPMEGQGILSIKAFVDGGDLKISVTDNGAGMSRETMDTVLSKGDAKEMRSRFSGIGICNVHERIRMYFGEDYGLSIQSVPGLYTTVELCVPAVGKEAKRNI